MKTRFFRQGFALVETLVAMILVGTVLLPTSLWLYRSQVHRIAGERLQATQAVEDALNRALLGLKVPGEESTHASQPGLRVRVQFVTQGNEQRVIGTAINHGGKVIASMEAMLFGEESP